MTVGFEENKHQSEDGRTSEHSDGEMVNNDGKAESTAKEACAIRVPDENESNDNPEDHLESAQESQTPIDSARETDQSPDLSLLSSITNSEDDISSSREDSDRSTRKKKHRVRFVDTSITSWGSTVHDGFVFSTDPFSTIRKKCPRHILSSMDRQCKTPDTAADEFGIVSKRALPEHYYANTGSVGMSSRRQRGYQSPTRAGTPGRRDRKAVDDFSHPRCFANPKNNTKLITMYDIQSAGFLDTSLTSPNGQLHSSTSKMIRFNTEGGDSRCGYRRADSPGDSSQRTSKSPGLDSEGFFYGHRRPGVKMHSCVTDS